MKNFIKKLFPQVESVSTQVIKQIKLMPVEMPRPINIFDTIPEEERQNLKKRKNYKKICFVFRWQNGSTAI